jgi:hypothetical protein
MPDDSLSAALEAIKDELEPIGPQPHQDGGEADDLDADLDG